MHGAIDASGQTEDHQAGGKKSHELLTDEGLRSREIGV